MTDSQPSDPKSSRDNSSRQRIVKIVLVCLGALAIVFLGIKFIPGFFSGAKKSQTNVPSTSSSQSGAGQTAKNGQAQNTQYPVETASLLGLDKAVKSPHFTIYFHSADAANAEALINICENEYSALAKFFPVLPKTEILLTYDGDEYVNVFNAAPPWGSESYKDAHTSAGAFCPGCTKSLGNDTEYIYMLRPQNRSFAHELAHRYYWANYPSLSRDNSLTWLNEGQAVYVQNEIAAGPGGLSGNVAKVNDSPLPASFAELSELQRKSGNASLERFYDLVGLMAYYLAGKSDKGIGGFLADLKATKDLNKTCQNILGLGADEMFAKWQAAIKKTATENPTDFLASFKKNI